jgi:hypothetical protein
MAKALGATDFVNPRDYDAPIHDARAPIRMPPRSRITWVM